MTLTLAAVYAPIAFAPGRTGRLFLEFALTLAGAVVVSGFVALTLTPMMCSKLLRHNPNPGRIFTAHRARLHGLRARLPARCCGGACARAHARHRWSRSASPALERPVLHRCCKSELAPVEDRGVIAGARHGAGGRDARLHAPLQQPGRARSSPRCRRCDSTLIINGSPEVSRFLAIGRLERLGRARALAAADQRRDQRRSCGASPACRRPPATPARSAQRGSVAPGRVRDPDLGHLRAAAGVRRPDAGAHRATIRGWRASTPICSSTCPSSASRWTAPRSPTSASTSRWSAARSRRCSAAGR